jgi:pimeloyl-ACP methyl ester carboxylesterase
LQQEEKREKDKMKLRSISMGIVGVVIAIRFLANLITQRLEEKNRLFRESFQATHDAIDAEFNHKDLVVDGINWHYVEQGPAEGPVVLFMHGFPESWYSWRYILPLIDPKYRLIAIDMKGYGRSEKSLKAQDYNMHTVAKQTKDFMVKGLKVDKFYLVSHDWGTLIGSVMAGDHPHHILGYVRMQVDLVLPPYTENANVFYQTFKFRPQFLIFQFQSIAKLLLLNTEKMITNTYKTRMLAPFKDVDRNYITYEFCRPGFEAVLNYFRIMNIDFVAAVHNICKRNDFPFKIMQLQADSDPTQPKQIMDNVATECPKVELVWVDNTSHFCNFERPEFIAEQINKFLNREEKRWKKNRLE